MKLAAAQDVLADLDHTVKLLREDLSGHLLNSVASVTADLRNELTFCEKQLEAIASWETRQKEYLQEAHRKVEAAVDDLFETQKMSVETLMESFRGDIKERMSILTMRLSEYEQPATELDLDGAPTTGPAADDD